MFGMPPGTQSIRIFLATMLALVFAGCSAQDVMQKLAPPNEVAVARQYFDLLAAEKLDLILSLLPPHSEDPKEARRQIEAIYAMLPRKHPTKMDLIYATDVKNFESNEPIVYDLTFENSYAHSLLVFYISFQHRGPGIVIYGINVTPISEAVQRYNALRLVGKGPVQYVGALLALAILSFMIWTAIVVIRTPFRRRRVEQVVMVLFRPARPDHVSNQLGDGSISNPLLHLSGSRGGHRSCGRRLPLDSLHLASDRSDYLLDASLRLCSRGKLARSIARRGLRATAHRGMAAVLISAAVLAHVCRTGILPS
jgi:hypothetical protein